MLFEVGETIVYPHHGAATITEVQGRTVKGEEKASTVLDEVLAS
jgi:CarD family transcriptional regulator